MRLLRYWGPVLVWAAVISYASTGAFGSARTQGHIIPILHWLFPSASGPTLFYIHHLIRKGAHVFEYAVFALLVLRGFRSGVEEWRWKWALNVTLVVACYAALDEYHQSFVPGRGASAWDSLLDTTAGVAALLIAWALISWQSKRRAAASKAPA
jgi:VanZ family protein